MNNIKSKIDDLHNKNSSINNELINLKSKSNLFDKNLNTLRSKKNIKSKEQIFSKDIINSYASSNENINKNIYSEPNSSKNPIKLLIKKSSNLFSNE